MARSLLDDARYESIGRPRASSRRAGGERVKPGIAAALFVLATGLIGWYYELIPGLRSAPTPAPAPTPEQIAQAANQQQVNEELVRTGKVIQGNP